MPASRSLHALGLPKFLPLEEGVMTLKPLRAIPLPPDVKVLESDADHEGVAPHVPPPHDLRVPEGVNIRPLLPWRLAEYLHLDVGAHVGDVAAVRQPPLAAELVEVELDAALLVVLADEAADEPVFVLVEHVTFAAGDAAGHAAREVAWAGPSPVDKAGIHLALGVTPVVRVVRLQVRMLERDHVRKHAVVALDVIRVRRHCPAEVGEGHDEFRLRVLWGIQLLALVSQKLRPQAHQRLSHPGTDFPLLLLLEREWPGADGRRSVLQASHLRWGDIEVVHLVPGSHAGLRPHQAVVHFVPHAGLQLEVKVLLSHRHDLVGRPLLLLLAAERDLLGDEDVVRVRSADVRKVVLGDLEREDGPQEAVDGDLLRLVVHAAGDLEAVKGVASHVLGLPVARPWQLGEQLGVQLWVRLGVFHRDERLRPRAASRQLTRHGQPLELQDIGDGVVRGQRACRVQGLREPLGAELLQLTERGRHWEAVHLPEQCLVRDFLDLRFGQLHEGRQRLHARLLQSGTVCLDFLAAGLEVSVLARLLWWAGCLAELAARQVRNVRADELRVRQLPLKVAGFHLGSLLHLLMPLLLLRLV
mmetsp:Transcript_58008/g.149307  ORF Transcript_58008/g.149307 Transcript_58008/m.149307 type:complete len:586 (+) Transcript_58008:55-1812(+)